jgi:hypothetical protein
MARAKRLGFGRVSTDFKGERKLNEWRRSIGFCKAARCLRAARTAPSPGLIDVFSQGHFRYLNGAQKRGIALINYFANTARRTAKARSAAGWSAGGGNQKPGQRQQQAPGKGGQQGGQQKP